MLNVTTAIMVAVLGALPGTATRTEQTGNGVTTQFFFNFKTTSTAHIKVYLDDVLQSVGYSVALNANQSSSPGGSVTFTVAPADQARVRIERTTPLTQDSVWVTGSAFKAKTLEEQLDRMVMQDQQIDRHAADAEATEAAHRSIDLAAQGARDLGQDNALANAGTGVATGDSMFTATGSTQARSLKDRAADERNVKDFGVKCDGVNDDTDNFRAAAATGAPLVVPKMSSFCPISGAITLTNSIRGDGSMPEIRMVGATGDGTHRMFVVSSYQGAGLRISGLRLNGGWNQTPPAPASNEQDHMVLLFGSSNVTVEDNYFELPVGDPVYVGETGGVQSTNIHIRRNVIRNPYRNAVSVVGGVGVWIEDNDIAKAGSYVACIDLEANDNATGRVEDVHVVGNRFDCPLVAFVELTIVGSDSNPNTYKGVWVERNTGYALRMVNRPTDSQAVQDLFIARNVYQGDRNGSASAAMVRLRRTNAADDAALTNVVITENIDHATSGSWDITGGTPTILGNTIDGARTTGIVLAGAGGALVQGNRITAVTGQAIDVEPLSGFSSNGLRFIGNTFAHRIYFGDDATNVTIAANDVSAPSAHLYVNTGKTISGELAGNIFSGAGTRWGGTGAHAGVSESNAGLFTGTQAAASATPDWDFNTSATRTGGGVIWRVRNNGTNALEVTTGGSIFVGANSGQVWAGTLQLGGGSGPRVIYGSGAPSADAPIGSLYLRSDGGAGTSLYVKQVAGAGAGNWGAK